MKSAFELWIEEVEQFLGHKLTIPEWITYLDMYYDLLYGV